LSSPVVSLDAAGRLARGGAAPDDRVALGLFGGVAFLKYVFSDDLVNMVKPSAGLWVNF